MARKALFATDAQLAGKSDNEGVEQGNEGSGQETPIDASPRAVPVQQTPEQNREALGIEEELLTALRERADDETIDKWLREQAICCGELTLQRLTQAGHISGAEAQSILESYGYYVEDVKAGENILDILAFHIWVKLDTKGERADKEIRLLTSQLASIVPTGVTHCGFSRLSETPVEVYEKFPLVAKVCSTLMCPVMQVNERDFVSVASVNPVTAATVGVLVEEIMEREGVRPFTFILTLTAVDWMALCEKQFEIEV